MSQIREMGKLVSKGRKLLGGVKLAVRHESDRSVSVEVCSIGTCSDYYSELLKIYEECKKTREIYRDFLSQGWAGIL